MSKVLVLLAEGFEEIEGLTVVDLLRRVQIETIMVSIHEDKIVEGAHQIKVMADKCFEEADIENADLLVLPGGLPGTLNLGKHEGVTEAIKSYISSGKRVAAICAAPSILGDLGLLEGKRAVCYPSFEKHLIGAEVLKKEVVTDGTITTSRGMGTAIPFALELIRILKSKEQAREVAESIIYNA